MRPNIIRLYIICESFWQSGGHGMGRESGPFPSPHIKFFPPFPRHPQFFKPAWLNIFNVAQIERWRDDSTVLPEFSHSRLFFPLASYPIYCLQTLTRPIMVGWKKLACLLMSYGGLVRRFTRTMLGSMTLKKVWSTTSHIRESNSIMAGHIDIQRCGHCICLGEDWSCIYLFGPYIVGNYDLSVNWETSISEPIYTLVA